MTLVFVAIFPGVAAFAFFYAIEPIAFVLLLLLLVVVESVPIFTIVLPLAVVVVAIEVLVLASPMLESVEHFSFIQVAVLEQVSPHSFNAVILPLPSVHIPLSVVADAPPVPLTSRHGTNIMRPVLALYSLRCGSQLIYFASQFSLYLRSHARVPVCPVLGRGLSFCVRGRCRVKWTRGESVD